MQGKEVFEFAKSRSTFLVNSPPGLTTGRITLKVPLAEERVQEIAEWNGLIIEFDDDVTIELHGDKPDLQFGLKEMGSFFLEDIENISEITERINDTGKQQQIQFEISAIMPSTNDTVALEFLVFTGMLGAE